MSYSVYKTKRGLNMKYTLRARINNNKIIIINSKQNKINWFKCMDVKETSSSLSIYNLFLYCNKHKYNDLIQDFKLNIIEV